MGKKYKLISVIKVCLNCDKSFVIERKIDKTGKEIIPIKERKNCSIHCAHVRIQTKELNEKRSKTLKFPTEIRKCEWCDKEFEICITSKKRLCSRSCSSKYVNNVIGIWTKEKKDEQSICLKQAYKNGRLVSGGITKWIPVLTSNGLITVQGTYEERTCKILDKWKLNNKIKDWEYTNDKVEYFGLDGNKHFYLIDFKVINNNNSFYYLETKGRQRENDKLKWRAVRNLGYILEIWFKNDIKKHETML